MGTTLLLTCYACGDEEVGGLSAAASSAGNAVVLTARLDGLVADPRNEVLLQEMTRIYTELTTVANAGQNGPFVPGTNAAAAVPKIPLDRCVTVRGPTILYDDCTVSNGNISGVIIAEGDRIAIDLLIGAEGTGGSGSLVVRMTGGITLTATELEGQLRYDTIVRGLEEFPDGLTLTLEADYLALDLDLDRCPRSGMLVVQQATLGVPMAPRNADFGPQCGDVVLTE